MTVAKKKPEAAENGSLTRLIHEDWFLQELVGLANVVGDFELGVTLNVQGSIISGTAISGRRYFEEAAKLFATEDPENHLSNWVKSFTAIYDEGEKPAAPPGYIHLMNARVFGTGEGTIPSNDGTLWRGRISAVSGFSFGSLQVTPNDES